MDVGEKVPPMFKNPWQQGIKAGFIHKLTVAYPSQQRQGCVWTLLLLRRQDGIAGSGWPGQIPDSGQQASAARKQEQNSYLCAPDWKSDGLRGDSNWKGETFKKGVKKDICFTNKKSSRLKNLALSILLDDNIPPRERGEMPLEEFLTMHPKEKITQKPLGLLCAWSPSSPLHLPQLLGRGRRLASLHAQP